MQSCFHHALFSKPTIQTKHFHVLTDAATLIHPTTIPLKHSSDLSRQIYEDLGPRGLEHRTSPEADQITFDLVLKLIGDEPRRLLDAGCGYGRIAIPLAQRGFDIVGVDISPSMLGEAHYRSGEAEVGIEWILGDIATIPVADESFDVVLCLWLTFHELLQKKEQLRVLREFQRVLKVGGIGLLDGPPFQKQGDDEPISGLVVPNEESEEELAIVGFEPLLEEVGISKFEQFVDDCPGRPRQFLRWWKT